MRYNHLEATVPFFRSMFAQGCSIIEEVRDSGLIGLEVKDVDANGLEDYLTLADTKVVDFYQVEMSNNFPGWDVILEDGNQNIQGNDVMAIFDPLDGTRLFKENKRGYSTMGCVAVRDNGFYKPLLGMFQIVGSDFTYASSMDSANTDTEKIDLKDAVMSCSSIERHGYLTPLKKNIGCEVIHTRGMAPNAEALINGEIDFFVYEPGIRFWDAYPITPVIRAHGGDVFDYDGNEILYDGSTLICDNGFVAIGPKLEKGQVLDKLKSIF